jgi:hypothetical protein
VRRPKIQIGRNKIKAERNKNKIGRKENKIPRNKNKALLWDIIAADSDNYRWFLPRSLRFRSSPPAGQPPILKIRSQQALFVKTMLFLDKSQQSRCSHGLWAGWGV